MKVTFFEPTILPGGGIAQANETRDIDVSSEVVADWKRRGIADAEEVAATSDTGVGETGPSYLYARIKELDSKIEELTEKALKDADVRSELESKLESANAALTLADNPELLKATVDRNEQLANCLETFIPDERKHLDRFKETHLKALAIYLGVEGELPELKAELADAVWAANEARKK